MTTLDDVVLQLVDELQDSSSAKRLRSERLEKLIRSVRRLVSDSISVYHETSNLFGFASIHKASGHYSSSRYSKGLSYRIHVKRAYEGLRKLGYLKEMKHGSFDGSKGLLTRYQATLKLIGLFEGIDIRVLPVLTTDHRSEEVIRVREIRKIRDPKTGKLIKVSSLIDYEDTPKTHEMRLNADKINENLRSAWIDLELEDGEWLDLRYRLNQEHDLETPQHNLSNRTLYRVFSDATFERGGRFYGGWWQNIPKEFRTKLIINGKRTVEFDYSGLHPAILYAKVNAVIPEDPYDIGLDPRHRGNIKKAFNAMLNASTDLRSPPMGFPLKAIGLPWKELKQRIKAKHSEISDYFGAGVGLELQYADSCMAEKLMLRFIEEKSHTALLPIHDSFIVHHGYAVELREMMMEIFERDFGGRISVKELERELIAVESVPIKPVSKDVFTLIGLSDTGYSKRLDTHYKYNLGQG
jgi:hypothetical protein